MAKNKTRTQLQTEYDYLRLENELLKRSNRAGNYSKVTETLIKWGVSGWCVSFVAYAGIKIFESIAGKSTNTFVSLNLGVFGFEKLFDILIKTDTIVVSFVLMTILSFSSLFYARWERKLRYRKIKQLHQHNRELESRLHSERTGSGLSPTGETNPEDH